VKARLLAGDRDLDQEMGERFKDALSAAKTPRRPPAHPQTERRRMDMKKLVKPHKVKAPHSPKGAHKKVGPRDRGAASDKPTRRGKGQQDLT
jgi:hypothetical protein